MKKIVLFLLILVIIVAGCSPDDFNFKVENSPTYIDGGKTEIVLSAHDDDELVEGLHLTGEMDTGESNESIEFTFTDNEDGTYTAFVDLPEAGEWVMLLEVANDKKESTYLVRLQVE